MQLERKIPELLAPAGDMDRLRVALLYGADAVYLGQARFSLRARAGNFDEQGLAQAMVLARASGAQAYVTVNIFPRDPDIDALEAYFPFLQEIGVDGVIIADPGIFALARRRAPALPVHVSTQANVTSLAAARFWAEMGAARVNLARELSLAQIAAIRNGLAASGHRTKVEVFVHGALCISYSGRCLLSSYLTGRDANHGDCAQPCRWGYALMEEKRPGKYLPVEEDQRGSYIMSARDLCLLERLPELAAAGVDSLKIEGRMKSGYYLATTIRAYRAALDWLATAAAEKGNPPGKMPPVFMKELRRAGARGFCGGFAGTGARPGAEEMLYDSQRLEPEGAPAAIVVEAANTPLVEPRLVLAVGDQVEYLRPRSLATQRVRIVAIRSPDGSELLQAGPGRPVRLDTIPAPDNWSAFGLLRAVRGEKA